VVQRISGVDELRRFACVLVREETGLDPLDRVAPAAGNLEHRRGHVDADDAPGLGRGAGGEQTCPAPEVDERRPRPEPVAP
jgi:hypothetical protein